MSEPAKVCGHVYPFAPKLTCASDAGHGGLWHESGRVKWSIFQPDVTPDAPSPAQIPPAELDEITAYMERNQYAEPEDTARLIAEVRRLVTALRAREAELASARTETERLTQCCAAHQEDVDMWAQAQGQYVDRINEQEVRAQAAESWAAAVTTDRDSWRRVAERLQRELSEQRDRAAAAEAEAKRAWHDRDLVRKEEIAMRDRAAAAEAKVARVEELHVEVPVPSGGGYCNQDGFFWPCPTRAALEGSTA